MVYKVSWGLGFQNRPPLGTQIQRSSYSRYWEYATYLPPKRPPLYLLTSLKLGDRLCYLLAEVGSMGQVRNE